MIRPNYHAVFVLSFIAAIWIAAYFILVAIR